MKGESTGKRKTKFFKFWPCRATPVLFKDTDKNKKEVRASLLLSISFGKRRPQLIYHVFHRIR
ncbi:hypothetical protein HMPREF9441_00016 [Paraprevotella clara YIT 11840]|uniref:Uncharacterized protein n=1 Tax=Paraprevotella clara YIT 11840 TaxID=762968 RepID=G5SKZ9_9BACT|nr:hypothetical protein HMPREF9441_00016 [Paraprevotella clara YIT 11840]MBD9174942.1 hypothetical protein [Paraprevotella clara]